MNEMMHSAKRKSVTERHSIGHNHQYNKTNSMLTFISGYKVLYVLGNVLIEMQFADVERLNDGAIVEHQQPRVTANLKPHNIFLNIYFKSKSPINQINKSPLCSKNCCKADSLPRKAVQCFVCVILRVNPIAWNCYYSDGSQSNGVQ